MKKLILTIFISFTLAMLSMESGSLANKRPVPIVYKIGMLPEYGRKRPLKRHFVADFSVR